MSCTAEPASGSVMPMLISASPSATAGNQRSFIAPGPRCSIPGRPVEDQLAADGRRDVRPGDLLQHDGRLDVAQAHAAPLLPDGDAEKVGGGQGLAHLGRDLAGLVPL